MLSESPKLPINVTDDEFNAIYPSHISAMSRMHWTPIAVVKAAAKFLAPSAGTRVLDIGSGSGKFCLVGAVCTEGEFVGVEQRSELVDLTNKLATKYGLSNVTSIHANITSVNFGDYDSFYFFNAFQENIDKHNKMDDAIMLGINYYETYTRYTISQLAMTKPGTRLATYFTAREFVPTSFELVNSLFEGRLLLWEKMGGELGG